MIGLVMAGGKGTRMNLDDEKLLLKYKKPIVLHVLDSLKNSNSFSKILAITSKNSPKTMKFLLENNFKIIESSGNGYVEDLNTILKSFNDSVFITSGDLPLLDADIVKKIVQIYDPNETCTTILVSKKFLNSLGISSNYEVTFQNQICVYTGISIINSEKISNLDNIKENFVILDDKRIGFNVNTKNDYDLLSAS